MTINKGSIEGNNELLASLMEQPAERDIEVGFGLESFEAVQAETVWHPTIAPRFGKLKSPSSFNASSRYSTKVGFWDLADKFARPLQIIVLSTLIFVVSQKPELCNKYLGQSTVARYVASVVR